MSETLWLLKGRWVQLSNGWILGPLIRRISVGPFGAESERFTVAGAPPGCDWDEHGAAYRQEFNVLSIAPRHIP